jgi:hypothetical protein
LITRRHAKLAIPLALGLLLAGCGGGGSASDKASSSSPAAESAAVSSTWPLTGLPSGGKDTAKTYPVLVTKIDNTKFSEPQAGLSKADLVVEELVEGGLTRLAAFYYSRLPDRVGPVRSMRASDIGIVSPAGASVITSGAAAVTISRIRAAGIKFFEEGADGLSRDSSRSAPYNVFADLTTIAKSAKRDAATPPDYLRWGDAADFPKGWKATKLEAGFGPDSTQVRHWVYDGKGYRNIDSHAASDDQFPADTVMVLKVPVGDAGYRDPAGNPVPETIFKGSGQAMIFHGGRLVRCDWSKPDLKAPISLTKAGTDLSVPAGHTWIELIPEGTGTVSYTK